MSDTPSHRMPLAFILVTILIDSIGFGIIIPVVPELIMELTGGGLGEAAIYGGWLLFAYALMQFFFAPVLGNLSDRFGRRPVLLCSLAAFGADYIFMGFAPTITWLFVGRLIAGVTGATHATANAYAADITPPEERAKNFGRISAAWSLGFILGPVIGGFLGELGPRIPFFAAAALAFANVVYGLLVLPETLPVESRRPFRPERANPIGAFRQMRAYPFVVGSLLVLAFVQLAHDANPSTWSYYTMLKFDWSERQLGLSLGVLGVMMVLVQAVLVQALIDRMGERRTIYFGFGAWAVGYAGFAFSTSGWMMIAFMLPFALGGVAMPALRGILSNQVPESGQGELQGALASLGSLTAIFAPLFMTQLFGYFTSASAPFYFPGAPFFAAAVLVLASILWFTRTLRRSPPALARTHEGPS